MKKRIYLDNNATTGLDPLVLEAMLQDLNPIPANPSSVHFFGQEARNRLGKARQTIADFFKVKTNELFFTSGGTESLHMILEGFCKIAPKGHIITSDIEHSCVYQCLSELAKKGWDVSFLPAGLWGAIKPEEIEKAIRPDTRLIVLGAVNSETGTKHDIDKIAELAQNAKIPFVVDGVALLGKELFTIPEGVSAIGFSGHKIHAPKGIGVAIIRSSFKFQPLLVGGDQEFSKRAGTENLSGILGFAKAIELLKTELPEASERMKNLRDHLEQSLIQKLDSVLINGQAPRTVNITNLSFPEIDGETLLIQLDLAGIAVSHGSACSSGSLEPSRILTNMGLSKTLARSSLRFSLSRWTTKEEIDETVEIVSNIILQLRNLSSINN